MADQQIKTLKTKRGLVKAKLTRFKTYLSEVELSKDLSQLETRLSKFQDNWNEFDAIQLELELTDETDDALANERESIENLYFELVSRANSLISIESPRNQLSNKSTHSYNESMVKLPTIKLPTFSGNYEEWPQFYELFCSLIDDNQSLSTIQKFHYLKSSLQGQALNVIESIEVSASNYDTAWTLLKNRFDNKRVIVNNHVSSLFEINNLGKESAVDLRNLLDLVHKHVRALKSLGQPTDQWDTLLIHLIVKKLDLTTFKLWENQLVTTQLPTFCELTTFLENRCNILESIELNRSNGSAHAIKHSSVSTPLKSTSIYHQPTYKHQSINKLSSSFVICTPNCPLCKKNHKIFRCDSFLKMSTSSRLQAVKNQGLCINCLSNQHQIKDCTSTDCKHCGKRHNTLLHFKNNQNYNPPATLMTNFTDIHNYSNPIRGATDRFCQLVRKEKYRGLRRFEEDTSISGSPIKQRTREKKIQPIKPVGNSQRCQLTFSTVGYQQSFEGSSRSGQQRCSRQDTFRNLQASHEQFVCSLCRITQMQ